MASMDKRTITLPTGQARYVDSLVASGRYASESDVISAGRKMRDENKPIEPRPCTRLRRSMARYLRQRKHCENAETRMTNDESSSND